MYDQQLLNELQLSWPETTDYLRRVGQVTNDLMVLRELYESERGSATWPEMIAVDEADLMQTPSAVDVLRFLLARGRSVTTAQQVTEYQELRDEQEEAFEAGTAPTPEILEDPAFLLPAVIDARLWALPELQKKLVAWAAETATKHQHPSIALSLTQSIVLMRAVQYMEQDAEQSPEWAAECLRYALSSEFFARAGNLPQ